MPTKKNYKFIVLFTDGEVEIHTLSEKKAIELITEIQIREPVKKAFIEKISS